MHTFQRQWPCTYVFIRIRSMGRGIFLGICGASLCTHSSANGLVRMCLHVLGAWEGAYFWAFVEHLYAHIPTPVACTYVFTRIRSMGRGIFLDVCGASLCTHSNTSGLYLCVYTY